MKLVKMLAHLLCGVNDRQLNDATVLARVEGYEDVQRTIIPASQCAVQYTYTYTHRMYRPTPWAPELKMRIRRPDPANQTGASFAETGRPPSL